MSGSCQSYVVSRVAVVGNGYVGSVVAACLAFLARQVIGVEAALDLVSEVYRPVLEQSFRGGVPDRRPALVKTGLVTAETIKYAANAFLATKIDFINEVAMICELVGADVVEVAAAMGLDSRIGPRFLNAGVGLAGSRFGKDLDELISTAADYGHDSFMLRAVTEVDGRRRKRRVAVVGSGDRRSNGSGRVSPGLNRLQGSSR